MIQSMSRRNCYDNPPMKCFFASLGVEYLKQHRFATRTEARMGIFQYVETFCNAQRLHSGHRLLQHEAFVRPIRRTKS
jgi:putative transposase